MKRRVVKICSVGLLLLVGNRTSVADEPSFWHRCGVDRERNLHWPQPFRSADAAAVQAPFEIMKNNGWKLYNTMGSFCFNEQHGLTDAGRLRLDWVINQAPQDRRQVFVMRGPTSESTAARVEAVQLAISQMLPTGELPPVFITENEPMVSSGQYQTAINRKMINTTPNPRLPAFKGLNAPSNNSASGGGGGGGGGGGSSSGGSSK